MSVQSCGSVVLSTLLWLDTQDELYEAIKKLL